MRENARATGVHASTVMRHVRKIENNAEDPEIQALIRAAEAAPMDMGHSVGAEIARAKKSLRTTGAVLVVSKGMKRAVVLHPTGEGDFKQAIVISDAAVHMMVLQSTVRPIAHGRIKKICAERSGRWIITDRVSRACAIGRFPDGKFSPPQKS